MMSELLVDYKINPNKLRINGSYKIRRRRVMNEQLNLIRDANSPSTPVLSQRSNQSMIREWRAHNLLWDLHLFRDHTSDVDLDVPQSRRMIVLYFVLSIFYFG